MGDRPNLTENPLMRGPFRGLSERIRPPFPSGNKKPVELRKAPGGPPALTGSGFHGLIFIV